MPKKREFSKGQVLVVFKDGFTEEKVKKLVKRNKLKIITTFRSLNTYLIAVPTGKESDWINKFTQMPEVAGTMLDGRLSI